VPLKLLTALGLTAALLLSALAGAVIVGNATAEESKTYYACANKNTGVLRLVKLRTKCKAGETRVVWGASTATATPTPTPRPHVHVDATPAPTVTCNFSQSGTFGTANSGLNVEYSSECAIPWTGVSRIVWSVAVAVDLRPVAEVDAEFSDRVALYPVYEHYFDDFCLPSFTGCGIGLINTVYVRASMCADLSACSVTFSDLVSLLTHEAGDKVRLLVAGIPGRSFSFSGTFTITKE
jgi:hypothetical protein